MIRAVRVALAFMTTLPLPAPSGERAKDFSRSVWAYPLVGLLLGLILVTAFELLTSLPPPVRAVFVVGLWLLLTGALHFDGYCDVADAAFASKSPLERQRIAKDPAIGVFALAAGVLLLLTKVTLLGSVANGFWLVVPLVLSRTLVAWPMARFRPHASSRLGWRARVAPRDLILVLIAGLGLSGLWAWLFLDLQAWLIMVAAAAVMTVGLAHWLDRRMGGLGGDAYGALIEVNEVVVLLTALLLETF